MIRILIFYQALLSWDRTLVSLSVATGLNGLFSLDTSALKWIGVSPKGRVSKHVSFMLLFCVIHSELYLATTANLPGRSRNFEDSRSLKGDSAAKLSFLSVMFSDFPKSFLGFSTR